MIEDFSKFKDIHKGKRGFVISCGPSLKDIDLSLLKDEITFGTSLAYKSGLPLNYSCMGDYKIASQFWQDMYYIPVTLFVSRRIMLEFFLDRPLTYYFIGHATPHFHMDLSDGSVHGGGTSTFLAMQFAYWMGIEKLYVVGLDHYKSYEEKGVHVEESEVKNPSGQPLVTAKGKDLHHFTEDFYGEGVEHYMPTKDKMERSYGFAREAFWNNGREIWNASADTALSEEILPRVRFEDII